jgi:hypothetical protein
LRVRARITFADLPGAHELIGRFGLQSDCKYGIHAVYMFVDDSKYEQFKVELEKLQGRPVLDHKAAVYSEYEMADASFFELSITSEWGFPQPEDDFAYREVSFDRSTACPLCGEGMRQVKPYYITGCPRFGKNDITSLGWTYALLVTEKLKGLIEAASLTGVQFWPLLRYRKKNPVQEPIKSAYQLYNTNELPPVSPTTEIPIVWNLPQKKKPCKCGKLGRNFPIQFHYKRADLSQARDFNKTNEWLGGMLATSQAEIVSRNVYNLFAQNKIRGARFNPVLVED